MVELHSYAATSRQQGRILGVIAFLAALSSIGLFKLFNLVAAEVRPALDIAQYGWLLGPLTLTGVYSLFLSFYDRHLWRYFSGIPCVSGTWIGCTLPNYQDWPHLTLLKVQQNWSTMYVEMSHFWRGQEDTEWSPARRLGRDQSETASLSGKRVNEATFIFTYQHKGIRPGQGDFDGTMALILDLKGKRLQGKYFTNRPGTDGSMCSYGHVELHKLSNKLFSDHDAFHGFVEDKHALSTIIQEVLEMAGKRTRLKA